MLHRARYADYFLALFLKPDAYNLPDLKIIARRMMV